MDIPQINNNQGNANSPIRLLGSTQELYPTEQVPLDSAATPWSGGGAGGVLHVTPLLPPFLLFPFLLL